LKAISALTVLSGLVQICMPGTILRRLAHEDTPSGRHFFGTVGMFMVVVGGALTSALVGGDDRRPVVFWGSVQKIGAAIAVAIGVKKAVFKPLALLVAGFDFLSGVLMFAYWKRPPVVSADGSAPEPPGALRG
jgi:hypothetical protein